MQTLIKFLLLIALPGAWASPPVKWVDEHGNTHYGEVLPKGYQASDYQHQPINTMGSDNVEKHRELNKIYDAKRAFRKQEQTQKNKQKQAVANKCEDIRKQLTLLNTKVRLFERDSDGDKRYIEDSDRQQLIENYRTQLRKYCT